jgi:hypothetical protein
LNCRIELLSGPNNIKQVMEVYTEDGLQRSFFTIVQTPGMSNTLRVTNTATIEFPITVVVEPWTINKDMPIVVVDSGLEDKPIEKSVFELGGAQKWDKDFFKPSWQR